MHETRFRVRPTLLDSYGHLNHARTLELFEWARWEWFEAAGLLERFPPPPRGRLGPAVIRVEVDYRRELRLHDEVTVRSRLAAVEGARGVVEQEMVRADGEVAARLRLVFVMFDLERRRAAPMPPEIAALGEPPAPGAR